MSPKYLATLFLFLLPFTARAADGPLVKIELTDGTSVQGKLFEPIIQFTFEGGAATFDASSLDRLNLGEKEDAISVHSLATPLKGRCTNAQFTLMVDGATHH